MASRAGRRCRRAIWPGDEQERRLAATSKPAGRRAMSSASSRMASRWCGAVAAGTSGRRATIYPMHPVTWTLATPANTSCHRCGRCSRGAITLPEMGFGTAAELRSLDGPGHAASEVRRGGATVDGSGRARTRRRAGLGAWPG